MTSKKKATDENVGEVLVAWQKYTANRPEELSLLEGEVVELLDTQDPLSKPKRIKLDPELDSLSSSQVLDTSAAKHKLSVKPSRRHASARYLPSKSMLNTRWYVRQVEGEKREGWVPCYVLQSVDEPVPGTGLPGDAAYRRQAVVKELVETEQEFVKDLDYVVQQYLIRTENAKVPKIIKDNLEIVFGGLVEIADFHRTVLMEGVKYYANEPSLLGKAFLRLERDFDKHVNYFMDEPVAQAFLDGCDTAKDYYDDLSQQLGDDKTLSEHLKLPIQRINDFQLLLKELVRYSECLGEDCTNLQKALELMLSVPHRAQDDKFISSIEGYRGSIHKLGRLLSHEWFTVTFNNTTKERYLFLFKGRILVTKVRRISEDRSIFQLKDIIRQVEVKDNPEASTFELIDKVAGHTLVLAPHRTQTKEIWLKEIREFANDVEFTDDIHLVSESSTAASESVFADTKPFVPPQCTEAQTLLAAALKSGLSGKKLTPPEDATARNSENLTPLTETSTDLKQKTNSEEKDALEKSKQSTIPQEVNNSHKEVQLAVKDSLETKIVGTEVNKSVTSSAATEVSLTSDNKQTIEVSAVTQAREDENNIIMSRKSSRKGEDYDSSFSRRSVKSSYGAEGAASRYDSISAKYGTDSISSKYSSDSASQKYGLESSSKYNLESSSKYGDYDSKYGDLGEIRTSYAQRSLGHSADTDSLKYGGETLTSTYSSHRVISDSGNGSDHFTSSSFNRKYIETGDLDDVIAPTYYSQKYSTDIGDGESYSYRRTVSSVESEDILGGSRSRSMLSSSLDGNDLSGSKYLRRNTTSYSDDTKDSREALLSKYASRGESSRSFSEYGADDDSLSKYSKYERRTSRKSVTQDAEEDAEIEAEMRRKYAPAPESEPRFFEKTFRKSHSTEKHAKDARKYAPQTSIEEEQFSQAEKFASRTSTLKSSTQEDTNQFTHTRREDGTQVATDSTVQNGKSVGESVVDSAGTIVTTFKTKPDSKTSAVDGKPNFLKRLFGVNVEPGESAIFEVELDQPPDSLTWLKDNKPIAHSSRIITSKVEEEKLYRLQIKATEIQDAGLYTAIAANSAGKSTCSAQLIVHELTEQERAERLVTDKPVFLVQLKDTELLEDTYLRFMIKVKGDPMPTVTFYKNDVKIRDINKRCHIVKEAADKGFYELIIPEVKQEDAGLYKCVASNKFGEAVSEATVTVTAEALHLFDDLPPEPLLDPAEKPVFTWKKDGVTIEPEERFKVLMGDDEDSLALIFQHVKPEDAGLYTCVAQTSSGHISCSAELTVHGVVHQLIREPEKPTLVIEKKEAVAPLKSTAMLELQVKGYPKPQIKWSHDGKPITPGGKYKILYEDEESTALVIKNVEPEDAGKYVAEAVNELGADTAEITLTVKVPPKIKSALTDISESAGVTIKIPVEVEGIPESTVKFYKDGQEIKTSERIKLVKEQDKHILIIEKSEIKDTGSYSVVATNEISQVSGFWSMDIYSKPKIVKSMGSEKVVSKNESFELKVEIESKPEAEVKWYKGEKEISSSEEYTIKKDGNSHSLNISGSVTTDSTKYKFKAKNIHGTVEEDCQVYIKTPPKITKELKDMTVEEHEANVELNVKMQAYPKPTIKWYLDEMEITESRTEFTRIESHDGSKLVIKEVKSDLSGRYKCKVVNELGETETSAKLTVNCKPRFIKHLKDTTVDEGTTLHLEVEVEASPEPSVKWLRNGREVSADARIKITRDKQRHENYHLAVDLIKYEEQGEYEVVVTNSLGTVNSKSVVTVQKITHSDAIEEDEPPKKQKLKVQVIETDESQTPTETNVDQEDRKQQSTESHPAEKVEIEELSEEQFIQQTVSDDLPQSVQGITATKFDAEYVQNNIVSPEPLIEEPLSPEIPIQAKEYQKEIYNLLSSDIDHNKQSVITETVYRKAEQGKFVNAANMEVIEENNLSAQHHSLNIKSENSVSVSKQNADVTYLSSSEINEDVGEIMKEGTRLKKQMVIENGFEEHDSRENGFKESHKEVFQNGIIQDLPEEEDDEIYALLQRARKQRSIAEDLTKKSEQTLEAPPKILNSNLEAKSQYESLPVCYVVKATATPTPTAVWTLNGKPLTASSHYNISQNGDEFKLEIKKLDLKDAGVYECILTNPKGDAKSQAKLTVLPEADLRKPKFKKELQDQTVSKHKSAKFTAVLTGEPVPEVTWFTNGQEITAARYEQYGIILNTEDHDVENELKECTYSLTIPKSEPENSAKYTIKAKNKWGEAESSAQLTILIPPAIEGPADANVLCGNTAEFTATVKANPPPTVSWQKDGVTLEKSDRFKVIQDTSSNTYKLIIESVQPSDRGVYSIIAKNEFGETASEAKLRAVAEKPHFVTGLSDAQVEDGKEFSVKVRADGLPKPEIRWFLNDKPIAENENHIIETKTDAQVISTLTIPTYTPSDAGQYKVKAINSVGEAETSAQITVKKIVPSFGKPLERSTEINEGEPLELKAKIIGSPKPTVQWYKDGQLVPEKHETIKTTVLPDGTVKLNIEQVTPADSGAYKLVIKNPHGEATSLCAVAINPKLRRPKLLQCIKDTKVVEGQPLRLEAQVSGYPPPEIKWLKDGVPLRASSNIHFEEHPNGVMALIVDCVKPENAGSYTMLAINKIGETENVAKVEIMKKSAKPEFIIKMQPMSVVEGFPAKFEVKAVGHPAPSISWTRNNVEIIPDKKHIQIVENPDGSSALIIQCCDLARDPMTYRAIASNEAGDVESVGELTVLPASDKNAPEEAPVLLHALKGTVSDEGQPLVLEASFTANPMPVVEWFKDNEPLQPSDRIIFTCDGKKVGLHIDNCTPADAGQYSLKLTNPSGSDSGESKVDVRKVFSPPRFTQRFTDLQQMPGLDAKLSARVSGVPTPEVTWYKDGSALSPGDKYHIKRDGDLCTLCVADCEPSDTGLYRAYAVNKEGSDTCEGKLDIVDEIKSPTKAEPPSFLKRIGDLDLYRGMTAKFTACATGTPEPQAEWYKDDEKLYPSDRIKMEIDRAGLLRLSIFGIKEDDLGKYSCKISNVHGSDICHADLRFDDIDTKPKKPIGDEYVEYDKHKRSGLPVPLSDAPIISRMTDRHCTISWKPSIPSHPRAPVTYQLEMYELPQGDWFTARSGIRGCVCTVGNLEPFRDYKFRIRVENKYGITDPSPYATTHRQKIEPDLPRYHSHLPVGIPFHPDTSLYFPKDFDIDKPPFGKMSQEPRFLRQEYPTQYGVKDQNTNLFWYVYGYPKPQMEYYFNDEPIESGGRFDMSYTRNGQATLFINKMLDRDAGWYEAVATNEHGQARQRVRLEIAETPEFLRRPDIHYSMVRGKVRFEARIAGRPYPEVKWYKDWKPLAESSRIKIRFLEPDLWILTIDDVILKDYGLYSVSARNVGGTISSSAMLYVDESDYDYNIHTYGPISPIKTKRKLFEDIYDFGDELGRGTQGIVYHAVERSNGYNYAAKVMHGRGDLRPFMYHEFDMMNVLRHRRLISLHDAYESDDRLILVMELGGGGELVKDYLLQQTYYTETDIAFYIRQLLEGVLYMHDRGYGHMGLNIGDLLLSHIGGNELKITDFGLTRRMSAQLYPLLYGVPEYVSPEAVRGEGTGFAHDMWSIGIITYILLSGRSPFLGKDDRETLTRIKEGTWEFDMGWWSNISVEARDFISQLLVYSADDRMNVRAALRHPWFERIGRTFTDEYQIDTTYLRDYFRLYREWYDNASCRKWFRRRPLEGAFTHPSRMVYPPGEYYTPPSSPAPVARPRVPPSIPRGWEDQLPSRSPLNYEIGPFKSESHYQNGPDTYLLQLRDVNFPVRVREYMKVAANRGPGRSLIISDENGFDWESPTVRERRRFTDIMDEEIDDERKARINRYGTEKVSSYNIRRLRRELGPRLDTYAEAEAMIEMKQEGRLPFFREKPPITAMVEGKDLTIVCYVVGDPQPVVQWFKNDAIVVESARIKIDTTPDGRTHFKLRPALGFDIGMYRVVARNKVGQTTAWTRIVYGQVPDPPDSPEIKQISDSEVFLTWKPPKCDGNSPVLCYSLQYKCADDSDWMKKADNIDHEFYLVSGLKSDTKYLFRLGARNAVGWGEQGVSTPVSTLSEGVPKIQLSAAMKHLQQITDSGQEVEPEIKIQPDYNLESEPIEWIQGDAEEHYEFISEIFRGRFSAVFKAIDKRTDKLVVSKLVDLKKETTENLEGEFAALRSLRHERVAGLLAAYRTSDVGTFILEKLQGSDVLTYLASKHEYTEQTVATIVTQILDGLQYLHWRNLDHLDIQPENVVLCGLRCVQVKLIDFGNAHRVTKLGTKVPVIGHPDYISPEVLNEEPAYPQSDIWSLGVLTYVMLSGVLPFQGEDVQETKQNITFVRYRFEYLYQELSQEGSRFIMQIFKRHPTKRPTAEECHENRWLLPTDSMIKKRERAVFLSSRLKQYSDKYHNEKQEFLKQSKVGKSLIKSQSIQEELLFAP